MTTPEVEGKEERDSTSPTEHEYVFSVLEGCNMYLFYVDTYKYSIERVTSP